MSKKFNQIWVKRSSTDWEENPPGQKKEYWVDIEPGYIYLSWMGGRAYWILSKMEPADRPNIRANDRTFTIWINSYGIRFLRPKDYEYAKECLVPFSRAQK